MLVGMPEVLVKVQLTYSRLVEDDNEGHGLSINAMGLMLWKMQ